MWRRARSFISELSSTSVCKIEGYLPWGLDEMVCGILESRFVKRVTNWFCLSSLVLMPEVCNQFFDVPAVPTLNVHQNNLNSSCELPHAPSIWFRLSVEWGGVWQYAFLTSSYVILLVPEPHSLCKPLSQVNPDADETLTAMAFCRDSPEPKVRNIFYIVALV